MKIAPLLLKVHYTSSNDKITSFPGLKLVTDTANRLGILSGLGKVGVKRRRRDIPTSDFIMSLPNNFLVGGSHLTDLEALRSEKATQSLLYDLEVPAPDTENAVRMGLPCCGVPWFCPDFVTIYQIGRRGTH